MPVSFWRQLFKIPSRLAAVGRRLLGVLLRFGRVIARPFFMLRSLGAATLKACFFQSLQIDEPTCLPFRAKFVQVFPGVQPGVVPVIEPQAYGIVTDGFHGTDGHVLLASHQNADLHTVALDLGGRRMHAQVLSGQLVARAVVKGYFQQARPGAQANLDRGGYTHRTLSLKP
jgi:hypothetical protein